MHEECTEHLRVTGRRLLRLSKDEARRGQCGHPANARVEPLRDALNNAPLTGGVPALEKNNQFVAGVDHPILHLDQLALHAEELPEILTPSHSGGIPFFLGLGTLPFGHHLVIGLQLQLFIKAVDQIAMDSLENFALFGIC